MYRSYYSYSDMPQMIKKNEPAKCEQKPSVVRQDTGKCEGNKLLGRFETDDVILGIVALALLLDGNEDNLLLIALAIVFLSGLN